MFGVHAMWFQVVKVAVEQYTAESAVYLQLVKDQIKKTQLELGISKEVLQKISEGYGPPLSEISDDASKKAMLELLPVQVNREKIVAAAGKQSQRWAETGRCVASTLSNLSNFL